MYLLNWSKGCFCNSKKQIELVKKKIKEVNKSKTNGYRINLAGLKRKLAEAYKRKELYWS